MHWPLTPLTSAGHLHLHRKPTKKIHSHFLEDHRLVRAFVVRLLKALLIALCLTVGIVALMMLSLVLGLN